MENQAEQLEAMEKMMDLIRVDASERPQIREGALLFFAAGWPSNDFTLGMALAAGRGLQPERYEGFPSMARYKIRMSEAGLGPSES